MTKHENNYYHPMQSFPKEPDDWRIALPKRYRDTKIILHFLEAYHRGSRVFGPYGSIWLAKLKADASEDLLAPEDRSHWERLRAKYPELLGGAGK